MIERAVVKGHIENLIETRGMFTADIVEVGGDTAELLWEVYLEQLWTYIPEVLHVVATWESYELQSYNAGSWVPYDEVAFPHQGVLLGEAIANAVALVLIGKGEGLRHIGRKFLSPLGESSAYGNTLAAAFLADAAQILLYYLSPVTGIGGGTLTPGTVDKNGDFHPFVGGVVSTLLGSIRRRKPGIGI